MTEMFLLKKRGLFYRPDNQGYTAEVTEAGRYDKDDAEDRARRVEGVTVHAESEFIERRTNTVADIPDENLLKRAVMNARPRKGRVPKWAAVADTFGLGSTYSIQLCRRFAIDPDKQVGRNGAVT